MFNTTGLKLPQQKLKVQEDPKVVLMTMTSPGTKIFFEIGSLGDFEKMYVLYVAMGGHGLIRTTF